MIKKKNIALAILTCVVMIAVSYVTIQEEALADDSLIRFHVIANSDTLYDQKVKLLVRDAVLKRMEPLLDDAKNKIAAEAILLENLPLIEEAANAVLQKEHCAYTASAQITNGYFPTKTYGDLTLPAGKYRACRLILGEGKGKNWWCVLYPPLCFVDLNDDVAVAVTSHENAENEKGDILSVNGSLYQIKMKSKLLEWLH